MKFKYIVLYFDSVNFMAPGIMISIIFTITIGLTSIMFVIERNGGFLDRSLIAGVSTTDILIAHMSNKMIILLVQALALIITANLIFKVRLLNNIEFIDCFFI
jgi:ABC-type multidrug transport system permease subunit